MNARLFLTPLAVLAVACGSLAESPGIAPSARASVTPSATASPVPTASPTPRPNPTAGPGTYTSVALAYRVDLPERWRRAACGSSLEPTHLPAVEAFTSASADEEAFSDIGPSNPGVSVFIEDNAAKQTAMQWLESGKLGQSTSTKFEKTMFDGKPDAARVVTTDGSLVTAIVVNARGQIFSIQRVGPPPTGGLQSQTTVLNSFHILSDVELSDAKATFASPAPAAARSAEEVADLLAKGFAQKDSTLLATAAAACLGQGAEQAGSSSRPAARFLSDLQKSFASGLVVTAQPRPIGDQAIPNSPGYATIRGTWKDAGQPQRNVKLMLQKIGNTWYWFGVLYLQG